MRLVWALRDGDVSQIEPQMREILGRGYRYVTVSCEALSRLDQGQIARLRALLGKAPAWIVYYLRRSPERMRSLWQEVVKFGSSITFPEYVGEQLSRFAHSEFRDANSIDRFTRVFGATQIRLVSYSHLADENVDIVGHFLTSFLNFSDIAPQPTRRSNVSLPIFDTELIRALNAIHARHGGERSPALREWYLAHREGRVPAWLPRAMRDDVGVFQLDEATWPFAGANQDLVTRYRSSFVTTTWKDGPHVPRAIDARFVRQDYLLAPDVTKALRDIHEEFMGRRQ
jgi:hypothetical protein